MESRLVHSVCLLHLSHIWNTNPETNIHLNILSRHTCCVLLHYIQMITFSSSFCHTYYFSSHLLFLALSGVHNNIWLITCFVFTLNRLFGLLAPLTLMYWCSIAVFILRHDVYTVQQMPLTRGRLRCNPRGVGHSVSTHRWVFLVQFLLLREELQALPQRDPPGRAPLGDGQR